MTPPALAQRQHDFLDDAGRLLRHAATLAEREGLHLSTGLWWYPGARDGHRDRTALDLVLKAPKGSGWQPVGADHPLWGILRDYWAHLRVGNVSGGHVAGHFAAGKVA